jgi:transcriptional regulator with XRE-family HTH domain
LEIIIFLYIIYEFYNFQKIRDMKMTKDSLADQALSPAALDILEKLGQGIKTARGRRGIRQQELAKRASMSRVRLRKLEKGDPSVGLGALVQILEILGLLEQFAAVADPGGDTLGQALEARQRKNRVDSKPKEDDLDF